MLLRISGLLKIRWRKCLFSVMKTPVFAGCQSQLIKSCMTLTALKIRKLPLVSWGSNRKFWQFIFIVFSENINNLKCAGGIFNPETPPKSIFCSVWKHIVMIFESKFIDFKELKVQYFEVKNHWNFGFDFNSFSQTQ